MGEAKRRKLAGNTAPSKKWHADKAAAKHVKQVARQERAEYRARQAAMKPAK